MKSIRIIFAVSLAAFLLSFSAQQSDDMQRSKLLEIAAEYGHYRQVQMVTLDRKRQMEWTVSLCMPNNPSQPQATPEFCYRHDSVLFSMAPSASKHGNKLYQLFVKDYDSYMNNPLKPQPEGQVIVKETWDTKEVDSASAHTLRFAAKKNENDGKWYIPTSRSQLFIMYKEQESADNDKGWVYGIVDLKDQTASNVVINNGKLSNCIGCHTNTKYDRIFGRVHDDASSSDVIFAPDHK